MSKIKSNEQTIISEEEVLKNEVMALSDTSKKIRLLGSKGKSVKEIYKLINQYGVTTKTGGEIRYQHVRNVMMTKLTSE